MPRAELQIVSVLGKLKAGYKKTKTGFENLPEAAGEFGRSLSQGVKEDVARQGSAGQRFADAPLGQYYLPKKVQGALSFVAPSPRKVVRDTATVIKNPSPGAITAAAGNALSLATLPVVGVSGIKGVKVAGRAGQIANAARRIPLGERIGLAARGAITQDALYHGTTQTAARAIRRSGFSGAVEGLNAGGAGGLAKTFVTTSPKTAAKYANSATILSGSQVERPAIVVAKAIKGAKAIESRQWPGSLGTEFAFKAGNVKPVKNIFRGGERGVLSFPDRPANMFRRIKGKVMGEVARASEEGKRMKELPGKIAKTKAELAQIEKAPGNIIDLVKKGERGALKLPGGDPGDAARRVVKRAQLKAIRASIKNSVRQIRENLSTETTEGLRNRSMEAGRLFSKAPQVKVFRKLVKRELGARAAAPDTIVQTLGQTKARVYDSRNWGFANYTATARSARSLPKMIKPHPSRLPRN